MRRISAGTVTRRSASAIALGSWLAATAVMLSVAAAAGFAPLATDTWERWDSESYLAIAADGYDLGPCRTNPGHWCGTAGWFPAYPWLIRALAAPGLPADAVALAVALAFALGIVLLLARTFLRELPAGALTAGVVFAAFVPGAVYHHAVFPLSMLGFFTLLSMWLLGRGRWAWGGAAAAVAAASYHLGTVLVPLVALAAFAAGDAAGTSERLRRAVLAGGIAALGPAVVIGAMWVETGQPDAFFLIQARYDHGLHLPTEPLSDALRMIARGSPSISMVLPLQTLFVTGVLGLIAVRLIRRTEAATRADWLLLGAAALMWVVPLTQGNVGLYRTAAALVPLAPLVARLPSGVRTGVCLAAVALCAPIALLFLQEKIV